MSDRSKLDLINKVHEPILHIPKEKLAKAQAVVLPKIVERIDFLWNPNGTLKKIDMNDTSFSFVWTHNDELSQIVKRSK